MIELMHYKALHKTHYQLMIKTLSKLEIVGDSLNS